MICSPWGRTAWRVVGAGWAPGLTATAVEGSHVPGSVWAAAVVLCGGPMMGRLEMGMLTRVLLGGRLCGGGSRWEEGGSGCGGWGVLAWDWVRVWVRAGLLLLSSYFLWFLGLCQVVLVMLLLLVVMVVLLRAVLLFGFRFWFGVGFWVAVRFEVEEDLVPKDEEESIVFGDVGCAAMRAGAPLRAAAASAAATAGRMEGMSSGPGLGAGGWGAWP